jgi:hypothetical protein
MEENKHSYNARQERGIKGKARIRPGPQNNSARRGRTYCELAGTGSGIRCDRWRIKGTRHPCGKTVPSVACMIGLLEFAVALTITSDPAGTIENRMPADP